MDMFVAVSTLNIQTFHVIIFIFKLNHKQRKYHQHGFQYRIIRVLYDIFGYITQNIFLIKPHSLMYDTLNQTLPTIITVDLFCSDGLKVYFSNFDYVNLHKDFSIQ